MGPWVCKVEGGAVATSVLSCPGVLGAGFRKVCYLGKGLSEINLPIFLKM